MKKRIFNYLIFGFLLLSVVTLLPSCKYLDNLLNKKPEVETFTVTFDSNGGSEISQIANIESGSTISKPNNPTKENYEFNGWYYNSVAWNFESDKVTNNITLKAKWISVFEQLNNGNNKGSVADPYYIYDADSFVTLLKTYGDKTKPVRQAVKEEIDGELQDKLDENGNVVFEDIESETECYHFQLLNDIDFSNFEYTTLFNNGQDFIGEVNGNNFTIKNLSINVNLSNLDKFMYHNNQYPREYYARIAIIGSAFDAVIENISFDNINVTIDDEVINSIKENRFSTTYSGQMREFLVSSIIAYADQTTLKANVNAKINASANTIFAPTSGANGVAGIIAYAKNSTITSNDLDSKLNFNIEINCTNEYKGFYVSGVTSYFINSTISNIELNCNIKTTSKPNENIENNSLYISGLAGFVRSAQFENIVINLNINQFETERVNLSDVQKLNHTLYNKAAGMANVIRADNSSHITNITNVTVNADVNMDCIYSGLIYEVRSTRYTASSLDQETEDYKEIVFITIDDCIINSNVNTLQVFGVGYKLYFIKMTYSENCNYGECVISSNPVKYNLKITGTTEFTSNLDESSAYLISSNSDSYTVNYKPKDLFIVYKRTLGFSARDLTQIEMLSGNSVKYVA